MKMNSSHPSGMSDFEIKWVRLAPNGINLGLLKIMFQHISARIFKMPRLKGREASDTAHPDNSDFHTQSLVGVD